ncbi:hypothetical protein COCCADRAFT_81361 [Bipolaris zeicola 26-R-13]|uniref:Uncharacterized protein n=1 Tax=Cochliobolus carbonum (strain 26-R-13) TaxID=930089 RepID=W6YUK0_COCC2|nr:uncharacterized protein COCCADRAFT_81361 [Bipolaris zeicola 26-R-13]EUC39149.1 hypothetical protein COCCADRAFT_81361 [Bipolaris zeicola 26-R-13]
MVGDATRTLPSYEGQTVAVAVLRQKQQWQVTLLMPKGRQSALPQRGAGSRKRNTRAYIGERHSVLHASTVICGHGNSRSASQTGVAQPRVGNGMTMGWVVNLFHQFR